MVSTSLSRLPTVLARALKEVDERTARIAAEAGFQRAKGEEDRLNVELAARTREIENGEVRLRATNEAGELGIWQLDLVNHELYASGYCKQNSGRDEALPFTYKELLEASIRKT